MRRTYLLFSLIGTTAMLCPACGGSLKGGRDARPEVGEQAAALPDGGADARLEVDLPEGHDWAGGEAWHAHFMVAPPSIDLGKVEATVPAPKQTITVTASDSIVDLRVAAIGPDINLDPSGTCAATLGAGASCTVVVNFVSASTGAKIDRVEIGAGGSDPVSIPITALVQIHGDLEISPRTPQSFVAAVGHSSPPVLFAIANAGDTDGGKLTAIITGSPRFTATTSGCDPIPAGGGCTVSVVYTPTAVSVSSETATLTVTDAFTGATVSVPLTGRAFSYDPLWITSGSGDLGSVAVGSTGEAVVFTVPNSGDMATGTLVVTLSSTDFVLVNDTCTGFALAPGASCTFGVALRPTSRGPKSAVLTVSFAGGSPAIRTLTGTGV